MCSFLRRCFRIKSTWLLLFASLFCVWLSGLRVLITKDIFLLFLCWNLLLAFIPWCIALLLYVTQIRRKGLAAVLLLLWLVFFPNAPYILTDIIHLKKSAPQYVWFDFALVLAYAFTGLMYAYISLDYIEAVLRTLFHVRHPFSIAALVFYLSGYGIYLGRFLRWNSWDILINIRQVVDDVLNHVLHPVQYKAVWFFAFLMGTILCGLYAGFKLFGKKEAALEHLHGVPLR